MICTPPEQEVCRHDLLPIRPLTLSTKHGGTGSHIYIIWYDPARRLNPDVVVSGPTLYHIYVHPPISCSLANCSKNKSGGKKDLHITRLYAFVYVYICLYRESKGDLKKERESTNFPFYLFNYTKLNGCS